MRKYLIFVIILLALIVRIVYFMQIKDHFLFKYPILDAKYYHTWAVEISKGDWAGSKRGVFMMSPGYSYFLALVYKLFGENISLVVLIQFLLGLLTGWLVFLIGKKLFSETAGYLGAVFYLFYSLSIFYESTLLKSALINFVNVLSLYLLLGSSLHNILIAGALLGFSVHLRPNILIFVPFVLFWLYRNAADFSQSKKWALSLFLLGMALMLFPVALRNFKAGGEFVFSTAHGGMNFYTGNSAFCKGPYTPLPFARTDPEVEQQDFIKEAQRRSGKHLTAKESSSFWYKESLKFITGNPFQWTKLLLKKILIFINTYEPPINLDFYFFRHEYKSVLSMPLFNYGVILSLAVIGIFLARMNLLLISYMAVYCISGILFFVVSEYRFPIVPVLCIYAGLGAVEMYNAYRKGISKKFVTMSIALVLMFILSNSDIYSRIFGFTTYKRASLANSYFGLGCTYEDEEMAEEAIDSYEKAIKIMPQAAPMINLATIYERKGKTYEAQRLYLEAIKRKPNSVEAYNNLGAIFYRKKDLLNARKCFEAAVSLKPDFEQAQKNLEVTIKAISGESGK
ncbi:MAG: tetratricopeptide repeat protein [Endomicrobiales bacterium]|nr:tetratricopeptide repeat protein [Endomicrobiales bacterium]